MKLLIVVDMQNDFCYREPWNKRRLRRLWKNVVCKNQRNPGRTDLCDAGHASGTVPADKKKDCIFRLHIASRERMDIACARQ